jgi:23S rRNA (cytidine2498-2'-O)-methyltransferase
MLPALAYESLLFQCRPGFENDCAAELSEHAAALSVAGYCRARTGDGYVLFHAEPDQLRALWAVPFERLIFARQRFACLRYHDELPAADRVSPLLADLCGLSRIGEILLEHPDTNEGKQISTFCRKFRPPLERGLKQAGIRLDDASGCRLHLFFLDSSRVFVGLSDRRGSSPWPLGIPRLRMPRSAPSRSTLKLDEAIGVFLSPELAREHLRAGMHAVDLGAAPGGWSWQLAQRGLHVTAVDNGPMAPAVVATGLVEHLRVDGFRYRPRRPVDWLVCDMVEQPTRIAGLMAEWFARGDCREAIFNLKLPMKKRYQTVRQCLELIEQRAGKPLTLACKQLYHDRDEVTVYVRET